MLPEVKSCAMRPMTLDFQLMSWMSCWAPSLSPALRTQSQMESIGSSPMLSLLPRTSGLPDTYCGSEFLSFTLFYVMIFSCVSHWFKKCGIHLLLDVQYVLYLMKFTGFFLLMGFIPIFEISSTCCLVKL